MVGTRRINSNGTLVYFVVYKLIRFQCYFTIVSCKTVFRQIIKKTIGNIVLLLFFFNNVLQPLKIWLDILYTSVTQVH
jgi:hypothetical protein